MNVDKLIEELELKMKDCARAASRFIESGEPYSVAHWWNKGATFAEAIAIVKRHAEICDKCGKNN